MKRMIRTLLFAVLVLAALAGCHVDDITRAFSLAEKHVGSVNRATEEFTPEQEYYLGRAVAARLIGKYPPLADNAANAYLNQVGQALALCSRQPYTFGGYHFMLLDSAEINAFAAPDGLIFVTRGMVGLVSGESELAAVLAHEIAHVQGKDAVNSIKSSRMTEALTLLGKDVAGQYTSGLPGSQLLDLFSGSVDDIVSTMVAKGYSRGQEYAADAAAKQILASAGYDPRALDNVLRVMEKKASSSGSGFGSTHPSAADRLGSLNADASPASQEPAARLRRFQAALGKYSGTGR